MPSPSPHLLLTARRVLVPESTTFGDVGDFVKGVVEEMFLGEAAELRSRDVDLGGGTKLKVTYGVKTADSEGVQKTVVFCGHLKFLGEADGSQHPCSILVQGDKIVIERPKDKIRVQVDESFFPFLTNDNELHFREDGSDTPHAFVDANQAVFNGFVVAFMLRGRFFLPLDLRSQALNQYSNGVTVAQGSSWKSVPGDVDLQGGSNTVRMLLDVSNMPEDDKKCPAVGFKSNEVSHVHLAEAVLARAAYRHDDNVLFKLMPDGKRMDVRSSAKHFRQVFPKVQFVMNGQTKPMDCFATFEDLFKEMMETDKKDFQSGKDQYAFRTKLNDIEEKSGHKMLIDHPAVVTALHQQQKSVTVTFEHSTEVRPARVPVELLSSLGETSTQLADVTEEPEMKQIRLNFAMDRTAAPLVLKSSEWEMGTKRQSRNIFFRAKRKDLSHDNVTFRVSSEYPNFSNEFEQRLGSYGFKQQQSSRNKTNLGSKICTLQKRTKKHHPVTKTDTKNVQRLMANMPVGAVHFVRLDEEATLFRMVSGRVPMRSMDHTDIPTWNAIKDGEDSVHVSVGETLSVKSHKPDGTVEELFSGFLSWQSLLERMGRFVVPLERYEDEDAAVPVTLPAHGSMWLYSHAAGDINDGSGFDQVTDIRIQRYEVTNEPTLMCVTFADGKRGFARIAFSDFCATPAFMSRRGLEQPPIEKKSIVAMVSAANLPIICVTHSNDAMPLVHKLNERACNVRLRGGAFKPETKPTITDDPFNHGTSKKNEPPSTPPQTPESRGLIEMCETAFQLLEEHRSNISKRDAGALEKFTRAITEILDNQLQNEHNYRNLNLKKTLHPDRKMFHVQDIEIGWLEELPNKRTKLIIQGFKKKGQRGRMLLKQCILQLEEEYGVPVLHVRDRIKDLKYLLHDEKTTDQNVLSMRRCAEYVIEHVDGNDLVDFAEESLNIKSADIAKKAQRYMEQRMGLQNNAWTVWDMFWDGDDELSCDADTIGGYTDSALQCVEAQSLDNGFVLTQFLANYDQLLMVTFRNASGTVESRILRLQEPSGVVKEVTDQMVDGDAFASMREVLDTWRPEHIGKHVLIHADDCKSTLPMLKNRRRDRDAIVKHLKSSLFHDLTVRVDRDSKDRKNAGSFYLVIENDQDSVEAILFLHYDAKKSPLAIPCRRSATGNTFKFAVQNDKGQTHTMSFKDDATLLSSVKKVMGLIGLNPKRARQLRTAGHSPTTRKLNAEGIRNRLGVTGFKSGRNSSQLVPQARLENLI